MSVSDKIIIGYVYINIVYSKDQLHVAVEKAMSDLLKYSWTYNCCDDNFCVKQLISGEEYDEGPEHISMEEIVALAVCKGYLCNVCQKKTPTCNDIYNTNIPNMYIEEFCICNK